MNTNEAHEIFNDSYQRVLKAEGEFFETFYHLFLSSSDSVREMFRHVDMDRQKDMLSYSFLSLLSFQEGQPSEESLVRLANIHKKIEKLNYIMYENWLSSLLDAVEQHDPIFSEEIRDSWKIVLKPGLDFMARNGINTDSL